jgi:hypothetical protein
MIVQHRGSSEESKRSKSTAASGQSLSMLQANHSSNPYALPFDPWPADDQDIDIGGEPSPGVMSHGSSTRGTSAPSTSFAPSTNPLVNQSPQFERQSPAERQVQVLNQENEVEEKLVPLPGAVDEEAGYSSDDEMESVEMKEQRTMFNQEDQQSQPIFPFHSTSSLEHQQQQQHLQVTIQSFFFDSLRAL